MVITLLRKSCERRIYAALFFFVMETARATRSARAVQTHAAKRKRKDVSLGLMSPATGV